MDRLSAIQNNLNASESEIEETESGSVRKTYHLTNDKEGLRLTTTSNYYDAKDGYAFFKALFGTSPSRTSKFEYRIKHAGAGIYKGINKKNEREVSFEIDVCHVTGIFFLASFSNAVRAMMDAGESETTTMPVIKFLDNWIQNDTQACTEVPKRPPSRPIEIAPFETPT